MKALIIEEEFNDSPNVGAILQEHYKVVTAPTVEEGLKLIQNESPDMVLCGPNLIEGRADVVCEALSFLEEVAC